MAYPLTRRRVLKLAVLGGLSSVAACSASTTPTAAPTRMQPMPTSVPSLEPTGVPVATTAAPTAAAMAETPSETLAANMARLAAGFLGRLDDNQRAKATYAFTDPERTRWHWTTPSNFPRNGLPLREMTPEQRDQALALLQTGLSPFGFQKALDIMSLQNDLGNDPELYYVTVFGEPTGAEPWGWRYEGHHLSRHFTIAGDRVTLMPFFLGAWPTVSTSGLKAMEREEWAARELITALEGDLRTTAIFQPNTLTRHETQNQPTVTPLNPVGVLVGDLGPDQQTLVDEIVHTYLNTLPDELAQTQLERVAEAGFENVRFGWAGPLEPRRPHYYRLQGPTFLLEHDNSRNGGTHIHSVWRDFSEDFGQHLA
ncbi:MAG TPA: DUF3500 domain-containing protein [Anaerolineae bacterium]|nr:DUF3500 domain-containing protein [Anaerolineae bacterium]